MKFKRHLEALEKTKEMLEQEWKEGRKRHLWNGASCPLCDKFNNDNEDCERCPLGNFESGFHVGCAGFLEIYRGRKVIWAAETFTPIDETLSIIISFIQYYKEKQRR